METNTDKILKTMFSRLLQIEVDPTMAAKLSAVIDSVLERIGGNLDLEAIWTASRTYLAEETVEILQRGWHVQGQSIRPDHRMVAHTGFLTRGRLLAP